MSTEVRSPELLETLRAVSDEVQRAQSIYGAFTSGHEGYAVLLEEMDELKDEVWKSPKKRNYPAMRKEAIQVAAMAIRLVMEIADPQVVDEYRHLPKQDQQIPDLPWAETGDKDTCKMCGRPIIFIRPYWDHPGEIKPKHPAIPVRYRL